MIPVRVQGLPASLRTYPTCGPALAGEYCPACDEELSGPIALVLVGVRADPEDQALARAGRWHSGRAVAVHAACAGIESEETP